MTEWIEAELEEGAGATERVPKAWVQYNERADRVYDELVEEYGDVDAVTGFAKTKGETVVDGWTGFKPVVFVEETFEDEIPEELDGIPIETRPPQGELVLD